MIVHSCYVFICYEKTILATTTSLCILFDVSFCSQRFSIKGRVYPAIIPVEDKKVAGKVWFYRFGIQHTI